MNIDLGIFGVYNSQGEFSRHLSIVKGEWSEQGLYALFHRVLNIRDNYTSLKELSKETYRLIKLSVYPVRSINIITLNGEKYKITLKSIDTKSLVD